MTKLCDIKHRRSGNNSDKKICNTNIVCNTCLELDMLPMHFPQPWQEVLYALLTPLRGEETSKEQSGGKEKARRVGCLGVNRWKALHKREDPTSSSADEAREPLIRLSIEGGAH